MAGIICKWLNYEVKLSKIIEYGSIGQDFSNGYFFAQIFWRYGLIDSVDEFTDFDDSESIKKNFSLLEPLWDQLEIKTTEDIISDIQNAKTSTIIEQLYKMFVNIENQKCHIKQIAASAREITIQQDKSAAIREIEQTISDSVEACWRLKDMVTTRTQQLNVKLAERQEKTKKLLEGRSQRIADKLKVFVAVPNEISRMEQTKRAPYVKVTDYLADKKSIKKKEEAKTTYTEIDEFEQKTKLPPLYKKPAAEDVCLLLRPRLLKDQAMLVEKPNEKVNMADVNFKWNQDYVDRIRLQLHEEVKLRLVRKQRKHQAVEEQLQLFQGTEREQIEEIMVEIMLRQSKFEKKLINELMLIRKEKAVILESRRLHAKQLAIMREKEFANALDLDMRKGELDRNYQNAQVAGDWQFHKLLLSKHKEQCQKKHYEICLEIMTQIVDLSVCVSHHLTLIGNKIPPRLWREWKILFIQGKPFFSQVEDPTQLDEPWEIAVEDIQIEEERLNALDEAEFQDFKNRVNDWEVPQICDVEQINIKRSILGHIVYTILGQVYVFPPPQRIPEFPIAPFKLCLLGKPFVGKTALCEDIVDAMSPMPIKILNSQNSLEEALIAYHDAQDLLSSKNCDAFNAGEGTSDFFDPTFSSSMSTLLQSHHEPTSSTQTTTFKLDSSISSSKMSAYYSEEAADSDRSEYVVNELTPLAVLGYLAWNTMKLGMEVDDNVMVKIILEIVRQLPDGTSWILDGFPVNLAQAKFLETGMSAYYTPEDLYILHSNKDKEPNIYELRSSHLLSNPDPPEAPSTPKCSIDLVVYLEAEDENVLRKASQYIASTDMDLDFSQVSVHERLKKFNEDWVDLRMWFGCMNALHIIPLETGDHKQALSIIINWLNNVISQRSNPKDLKPVLTNRSDSRGEEHYSRVTNDKSFQFPTPRVSVLNSNMQRLPAGEEFGDSLTNPQMSDTEMSFSSARLSDESSSPVSSTTGSVISSLVISMSERRPCQPGDGNWEFVNEPIPSEIAGNIARTWQNMEIGYIEIIKRSFRKIRQYQDAIIQTFYNLQQDFKQFLQRPDNKQGFVSRWQEEYNALDGDMRADEETKSELHMRVDDLRHLLWEISDHRLQESKIELSQIASCGWLDDWLVLMSNRYVCVLQAEVDRFYDTIQVISDYYDATEGVPLKDLTLENSLKLPLLDMSIEASTDSSVSISIQTNATPTPTPINVQVSQKGKVEEDDAGFDDYPDSTMHRIFTTALIGIEKRLSFIYQGFRNGNEIKEHRAKRLTEDVLSHIPQEILNAGVKQLVEPIEKINLEFFAAVAEEECRVKTNMWLIEHLGLNKSMELTKHLSQVYGHLESVLAIQYRKELDAIQDLCRAMGYAIEQEIPLQEELVLSDDTFFVNADIILFPPTPAESKINAEESDAEGFTVTQLLELCKQFLDIAPTGFIATYQLENIFNDIIAKDNHLEIIPDDWLLLKPHLMHKLMDYISGGQEFINWRLFLLYLTKPWPQPSQLKLIETLDRFRSIDIDHHGTINKLQYDKQMELWLASDPSTTVYSLQHHTHSRFANLKQIIFEIFNLSKTNPYIDYFDMLNHFTADDNPMIGFTNALGLACGYPLVINDKEIPRPKDANVFACKTEKFLTLERILQERPPTPDSVSNPLMPQSSDSEDCLVPFSVVFHVFQYTQPTYKESNRMDITNAETLLEELENIFLELGSFDCEPALYSRLVESSRLKKKIKDTSFFQKLDIYYYVQQLLHSSFEDTDSLDDDFSTL